MSTSEIRGRILRDLRIGMNQHRKVDILIDVGKWNDHLDHRKEMVVRPKPMLEANVTIDNNKINNKNDIRGDVTTVLIVECA